MYTQVDILIDYIWRKNKEKFESSDCDKAWFKAKLENAHCDIVNKSKSILIPWIIIFEESLYWLHLLHDFIEEIEEEQDHRAIISMMMLIHRIFREANSIRILILYGYQDIARIIFRSFIEDIELFIIILFDESIATEYSNLEVVDSKQFWHKHLSKQKAPKKLEEIFNIVKEKSKADVPTPNSEKLKSFLSNYVHSSPSAGFMGTLEPSLEKPGYLIHNHFGAISSYSPGLIQAFIENIIVFGWLLINIIITDLCNYIDFSNHLKSFKCLVARYNVLVEVNAYYEEEFERLAKVMPLFCEEECQSEETENEDKSHEK